MTVILPHLEGSLLAFLLTFARAGAIIMLLPMIGDAGVPPRVRLAFALAVSGVLTPVVAPHYPTAAPTTLQLTLLIGREVTAGVMVGAMTRLIMSALQVAGYLIATQTGLAFATTMDPSQNQQGAVVATFLTLLGSVLVFETGLHHLAIGAIADSYQLIPPDKALPVAGMTQFAVDLVASAFALGLQLAAPFVLFGLLIYATLGVLSRLMPQLQVFFLATPVNIFGGFALLMLFMSTMMSMFLDFFSQQMSALFS
jgi:flagellar biosynthetic protein FliR